MIILKNISESNITEYPIAEPELSNAGEVRYDGNGSVIGTGQTLLWSLDAGETKAFPEYVANYLLKIFGQTDPNAKEIILEVVKEEKEEVEAAKTEVAGQLVCRYCGQSFKNNKGLALHIAGKHPEKL